MCLGREKLSLDLAGEVKHAVHHSGVGVEIADPKALGKGRADNRVHTPTHGDGSTPARHRKTVVHLPRPDATAQAFEVGDVETHRRTNAGVGMDVLRLRDGEEKMILHDKLLKVVVVGEASLSPLSVKTL